MHSRKDKSILKTTGRWQSCLRHPHQELQAGRVEPAALLVPPLLTRRALIWSVPWSWMDVRGSLPRKVKPSLSQLMTGRGSPVALHLSRAVPSTARVWLTGPWRMMGGGRSVKTKTVAQALTSTPLTILCCCCEPYPECLKL